MPFHIEFRPKDFSEVRGNKEVVNALQGMLGREDKPHSYLLIGPSGCGKTTLGRIIASELKCDENEYFEFNTADDRTLDFVRSVIENVTFRPTLGKIKFLLFDECHTFTSGAQEALLKLLESPPSYVFICLCTTAPEKLISTIKNRCEIFTVHPLNDRDLLSLLLDVIDKKELKVSDKILEKICEQVDGCPRKALILLEKVCYGVSEEDANKLLDLVASDDTKVICAKLLNRQKD
jgi:DNA polymerase-3 subunit gamma/tau